ncbi:hypothetical protein GCM10010174_26170 [Kutzneria viridogrisea]|uniref:BON domain-containing protein n=1 Tax=Kutzneria viridogrisea TaxID=47990 RepID=A0ABR6BSC6_9PSEU|nr:hypothetical protein [Kutzneria viridogrisea]
MTEFVLPTTQARVLLVTNSSGQQVIVGPVYSEASLANLAKQIRACGPVVNAALPYFTRREALDATSSGTPNRA